MSAANACAVGYFFFVISESCASGYWARGRKPAYQMSNDSSGRPSRFEISWPTSAPSGAERICSARRRTSASGISRSRANIRSTWVLSSRS